MINPMEEATKICVKVGLLLLSGDQKERQEKRSEIMMGTVE